MNTSSRPERPIRQFYIGLPADIADALDAAAMREDRPGKMQAARYVASGLRRDGYLPPEHGHVDPVSGCPDCFAATPRGRLAATSARPADDE
jgi:hypothetical protein